MATPTMDAALFNASPMPSVPLPFLIMCKGKFGNWSAAWKRWTDKHGRPSSGIYFAWLGSGVAYVGQSKDIGTRLSSHDNIHDGDGVSWLEWPKDDLLAAECYYIWLCRPYRNFSGQGIATNRGGRDGWVTNMKGTKVHGVCTVTDA